MSKLIDITRKKYGRLTVLCRYGNEKPVKWLCKCECGNECIVYGDNLKRGHTKSCGCIEKERPSHTKHGKSGSRIHVIWVSMKGRCYNPNNAEYETYGGRGIAVCDEWLNSFEAFYEWTVASGYADDLSIDRKDVNGNYEPSNCRWATQKEQQNNRRNNRYITYNGETHTMAEWARILNINYGTLCSRINRSKYDIERAFNKR